MARSFESDQIDDEENSDTREIVKDLLTAQVNNPASEVEEWVVQCDKDCETSEELNNNQIIPSNDRGPKRILLHVFLAGHG